LVVGFADSLACLVGRRWGRRKHEGGSQRTWLGTATFATVTLVIILGLSPALHLAPAVALSMAISIALGAAALEAVSPSSFDNFSVPIFTTLLLNLGSHWDGRLAALQGAELVAALTVLTVVVRRGWLTQTAALWLLPALTLGFAGGAWSLAVLMVLALGAGAPAQRVHTASSPRADVR
jgi:hypothetical protein